MNKRVGSIVVLLLSLGILGAACAPAPTLVAPTAPSTRAAPTLAPTRPATNVPTSAPTAAAASVPTSAPVTSAAATVAPGGSSVTVVDDSSRNVTIPAPPQRILSLAPSTTEIAFALGLGSRVIAVDTFSDYPAEVKKLAKINTSPLNLEQVVALKPDLVLAAGITSGEDIKKMVNLNLTVLVVGAPTTTFDNVINDITLVGRATGTADKAKAVTDAMKQKIAAVEAKVATAWTLPKVYWELDATDPAKPYAPGPGSFINDIIGLAGGTSVTASSKSSYIQVNAEQIIAANPDIIILSDFAYGTTVESVKARPGWSAINAVKNDKVLPIDDNLVSRPGPRIADGLEAAARLIHPELFQ
ncbi:MAG: helical backbone metal receptor [Chloroflexi bacterium]|nr:helical backbone metal receptor [Chloroflexota bacterium]